MAAYLGYNAAEEVFPLVAPLGSRTTVMDGRIPVVIRV
jgi:hypothetical protein